MLLQCSLYSCPTLYSILKKNNFDVQLSSLYPIDCNKIANQLDDELIFIGKNKNNWNREEWRTHFDINYLNTYANAYLDCDWNDKDYSH